MLFDGYPSELFLLYEKHVLFVTSKHEDEGLIFVLFLKNDEFCSIKVQGPRYRRIN